MEKNAGLISMRNEDGTHWLMSEKGVCLWSSNKYDGKQMPYSRYTELEAATPESRKRDSFDNGFFGIYNLQFHEGDVAPVRTEEDLRIEREDEEAWEKMFGDFPELPDSFLDTLPFPEKRQGEVDIFAKLYGDIKEHF